MKRIVSLCAALAACSIFIGCDRLEDVGITPSNRTPYNPEVNANEASVRRNVQYSDIPVPLGYKLRRDESTSFQGSTMRFGKLVYDGLGTTYNTSQWYMSNMPQSGWELIDSQYRGQYRAIHTFAKGRERAKVDVFSTDEGVRVIIDITNDDSQTVGLTSYTQ